GEIAVAEQRPIEIEMVWSHLAHRLRLAVGDIGADAERQMVGCYPVARLREATRVIADDVVAQTLRAAETRGYRQILSGGKLDRFFAADDRHPDWRARPLHRPRPEGNVFVRPEDAVIGKDLLAPRPRDDVERFLEAGARLRQGHIVHLVLAGN